MSTEKLTNQIALKVIILQVDDYIGKNILNLERLRLIKITDKSTQMCRKYNSEVIIYSKFQAHL